jgi:RND family efflux transporter MFP subunit
VERAKGDLQRAQSAHALNHLSYARLENVIKVRPNLVAQQEIDEAAARDRESEAQIDSAKAALAAAEEQVGVAKANADKVQTLLDYTRITAPFAGVITRRFADTGAMVQAGTASQSQAMPVVRLSQNDRLRLVLPVPEAAVPRVHLGAPVQVRVSSLNRTFEGRISRFADKVDQSTRTMWTEVDVPNPQLVLMPGMYAYADFAVDRRDAAVTVPVQAVAGQGGSATVLVVNARNRIEERAIKLGMETSTKDEILAGIAPGDLVVIGNRGRLRTGAPVAPKLIETGELSAGDAN